MATLDNVNPSTQQDTCRPSNKSLWHKILLKFYNSKPFNTKDTTTSLNAFNGCATYTYIWRTAYKMAF